MGAGAEGVAFLESRGWVRPDPVESVDSFGVDFLESEDDMGADPVDDPAGAGTGDFAPGGLSASGSGSRALLG